MVASLPYCGTELAYGDGMCGTKVAYGDGMCGSEMAYDGGLGGTETAHGSHTKRGTEIAYGGQDLEDLLTLRLQVPAVTLRANLQRRPLLLHAH